MLPLAGLGRPPERIAILGNAAGTTARAYGHYFPETIVDGVEIDAELEEVGNRFFDMASNENLTVHDEDARPWLRRSDGGYDAIFVDAYRQPYIPFYLATHEFFELVRDRLAPGGVVVVNAGHPEGNDDLEKVLGRDDGGGVPDRHARPDRADQHAARRERGAALGRAHAGAARAACRPRSANLAAIEAARLGPRLEGGAVYTDDRAPVEWLIDRSILGYAGEQ